MEVAKFDVARFETALNHLIEAADAANRYIVSLGEIDATDFQQRELHVFRILDPIGRARVEVAALPHFQGIDEVKAAIKTLEKIAAVPESNNDLIKLWDPVGVGIAIRLLSQGRSECMREAALPPRGWWSRRASAFRRRVSSSDDAQETAPPPAISTSLGARD
ncbi:hypothetical protein ACFUN8_02805 [Streptomyces sp. NPDC057307]|uniref:hypothetical protein n=1 Tax=Streptomyces sp. NPDC057307 TaxID=3346096 RepID=UPI00363F4542